MKKLGFEKLNSTAIEINSSISKTSSSETAKGAVAVVVPMTNFAYLGK